MSAYTLALAVLLLAALLPALRQVWRGRQPADRLLAVQLIGSTGVAILLLLAESQAVAALRDVALLGVLLAAVLSAAFVRLPVPAENRENRENREERP